MKLLITLMAVVACQAAPQLLPYSNFQRAPIIAHAQSNSPAVMKIAKPGIRFNVPAPVQAAPPVHYSAPVQVAPAPVHYSAPVQVAPAPVQYAAPVQVAPAPVQYSAPVQIAPAPVQYAAPARVAATYSAPSPVVVAAAPEPLQAPDAPMPSIGVPHVGGQFHAQDEAGQYSFGHWGGPNTRVESRDYLGRTSGSFAYVDPIGDVQVRKYAAAPATGFKVAASDLPDDTPIVAQVKSVLAKAHADATLAAAITA